ncbi:unnamed protein product [Adineta steineri]|uniref:Uncharacterized protein n=1 Tax=Adineta steineri TaxID=433720 RepID=A0A813WEF3_9BILA|nr:unnamed protein product [Adineta steineri]
MFKCQIVYDCELKNHTNTLAIFKDGEIVSQCTMRKVAATGKEKTKLEITCNLITGYAGKDWKFVLGSKSGVNPTIGNETFIITLDPLLLTKLPSFDITLDEEITSASIFIPDCSHISETKYLNFQCSSDDDEKNQLLILAKLHAQEIVNGTLLEERRRETIRIEGCNGVAEIAHLYFQCGLGVIGRQSLPENCTFTCSVQPAVNYHFQVIRSSIPKYDGVQTANGTFPEERLPVTVVTKLDKATNIRVELSETNNSVALIYFTRPRGFFDEIRIDCFPSNQTCTNTSAVLTGKVNSACTNCTHITIAPIQNGIEYKCWANISRAAFSSINYSAIDFNTTLKPVLYKRAWLSNNTDISVEVIPQSDFNHIESVCQANHTQPSVCMDMKITHSQCTTTLISTFNGIPGCDYRCFFSTIKEDYIDVHSEEYTMSIRK